jgi:hypothetical protein
MASTVCFIPLMVDDPGISSSRLVFLFRYQPFRRISRNKILSDLKKI